MGKLFRDRIFAGSFRACALWRAHLRHHEPKRRFDARFLAVDASAIAAQSEGVVHASAELVEIVWVGLDEAMRLPLPDITEIVLADIAASIKAGFPQDAPAPFYRMRDGRYVRDLM